VKVYPVSALEKLKFKSRVDQLIITSEKLLSKENQYVIDRCLELSIKVFTVPTCDQWIYGKLSLTQIKDLRIEDLLQREPIVINNDKISSELQGKRVLVTGGAGSIGQEIVQQVMQYKPSTLIICDQAETALHEMQLELEEKFPDQDIKIYIANIQNHDRMKALFKQFMPEIIFHAAAYKHVPMMEHHPTEAVLTNVLGTKNLADMAILFGAEKFVMISTDKAVNPTNVMGTTKRIAEMYVQSLHHVQQAGAVRGDRGKEIAYRGENGGFKTKFITTRFGNVLGSNGSVIPRFYKQIQSGGPVTVTHPDITRYFMTIPEAVQLVLEACTMGHGGEIFLFDMGKPVRIVELAEKMIKLAGLVPGKDIKISYTGLRPGEKLYEELLNDTEKTIPTHNEKIRISKVGQCSYFDILNQILELIACCDDGDTYAVVRKMKKIIPEFLSKNSKYEILDIKPGKPAQPNLIPASVEAE
jgi:FlaA1/EpsC-like NDP-sugar epimerase